MATQISDLINLNIFDDKERVEYEKEQDAKREDAMNKKLQSMFDPID